MGVERECKSEHHHSAIEPRGSIREWDRHTSQLDLLQDGKLSFGLCSRASINNIEGRKNTWSMTPTNLMFAPVGAYGAEAKRLLLFQRPQCESLPISRGGELRSPYSCSLKLVFLSFSSYQPPHSVRYLVLLSVRQDDLQGLHLLSKQIKI